nr:TRAP transporter large permease subunit [Vitreoscilla sp.]MBP6676710.1 TRAP transporter large permease subunit [Vitreoscilla sp.]
LALAAAGHSAGTGAGDRDGFFLHLLKVAGFDLIWFGILKTIVMETGLIHPPVGLNISVIKNIPPDIPVADIIWGLLTSWC